MNEPLKLLHDYPLFRGLDGEQIEAVLSVCREECFLPDAILFQEGQPADELFVLVDGAVEESFTAGDAVLTPIHPTGPGELIGCPALVPPYVARCTARAITRTEVLAIDAAGLRELFEPDCHLAVVVQQYVIQSLLERIGKLRLAGTEFA